MLLKIFENKFPITLLLLLVAVTVKAKDINEIFSTANQAYELKEYEKARDLYLELVNTNDPKVYFNLGNCYYRQKDYARAILYYEKSLKWGGDYNDNTHNLKRSREFLRDELKSNPELVVWQYWKRLATKLSANTWSIWAFIFLVAGVMILLLSSRLDRKAMAFNVAFGLFALSLGLYILAVTRHFQETKSSYAILMPPSVAVKSEPSTSSPDLFIIHSGIKLGLEREEKNWIEVELPDGKKGWLKSEYLEKI